jgi:hypothetical protein
MWWHPVYDDAEHRDLRDLVEPATALAVRELPITVDALL